MKTRMLALAAMTAALSSMATIAAAQAKPAADAPAVKPATSSTARTASPVAKTPWGDPDLQGTWDYRTITPLERARDLGTREFYTDEEAKTLETRAGRRMDGPPEKIQPGLTHAQYATDPGRFVADGNRTSLIVDPPDGRIPSLTAEAKAAIATTRSTRPGSIAVTRSAASPTGCRAPACRRSTTTTSRSCRRQGPR
jgi:hypothetical protein